MAEELSAEEKAIFNDIAETGIENSISALSKLSRNEWNVFSRGLHSLSMQEAPVYFPDKGPYMYGGSLAVKGELPMSLLYIMPKESAMNFAHFITRDAKVHAEMGALHSMAVAEVSNILANTFLSVIANTLKLRILPTEPMVGLGPKGALLHEAVNNAGIKAEYMLTCELKLASEHLAMHSIFCMLCSLDCLKDLVRRLHSSPAWSDDRRQFL